MLGSYRHGPLGPTEEDPHRKGLQWRSRLPLRALPTPPNPSSTHSPSTSHLAFTTVVALHEPTQCLRAVVIFVERIFALVADFGFVLGPPVPLTHFPCEHSTTYINNDAGLLILRRYALWTWLQPLPYHGQPSLDFTTHVASVGQPRDTTKDLSVVWCSGVWIESYRASNQRPKDRIDQ